MQRALAWMQACVILHNMLHEFGDEWDGDEGSDSESEDDSSDGDTSDEEDWDKYPIRRKIKPRAIAKARQPGYTMAQREVDESACRANNIVTGSHT